MMINKRLIATVGGSRKYVAGNVALQWCALAANIAMIGALCRLLERAFLRSAGAGDLLLTAVVAIAAVAIRFVCHVGAARMGYLSSREVKRTLREMIYGKFLRLGASYREQVKTSEVVQVAVEGVDQLETYFGAYLPPVFLRHARAADAVCGAVLCERACRGRAAGLRAADSHRDCDGADLGQKAAEPILGSVHRAGRHLP